MAELLVLRHAKSSWDTPGQPDHDRPLNRRGRRDAPRIGELLAAESLLPDAVLCSTACRTVETWTLLSAAAGCPVAPAFTDRLYLASGADLLEEIHSFPPRIVTGSETSAWWAPMAVAVIFGLVVSTVLTLVIVPVMYSLMDSFAKGFTWYFRMGEED